MAGNIKGITIEFRGDTTRLDKALRQVNNETKAIDKELRNVEKALKFNPTSVELWRQKQTLLSQKISETKDKLQLLRQQQAAMDAAGVDKQSLEYQKLQREIIETESKLKTFEGQLKKIGNVNLKAASEQFKQWGSALENAGRQMQGISAAAAGVVASLAAVSYKAGQNADDLNTLSKVYSINTQDLQKYSLAADLVDVSVEDIAKSHVKLEKSMYSAQNGSKSQAEAFEKLGVSVTNADGTLRDSDAVWQDTVAALGKMTNETERDALAQQLMGKSAANLNPLIEDQGKTYKQVSDTMKKYGLDFVDQETLDKANQFNDQLDTMKVLGMAALSQVGAQLAGYLAPALETVVGWVGKLVNWLSQLSPEVLTVIGIVAGVVAAVAPVLIVLGKLAFAISSLMNLANMLGVGIGALTSPIGIAIAAIAAIIAIGVLLYKNWDTIKAKALEIKNNLIATWNNIKATVVATVNNLKASVIGTWNSLKSTVVSVVNTLKSNLSSAWSTIKSTASSVWNGIKTAITTPIQNAKDTITSIIDKIKSKFPIKLGKVFSLKIPKVDVGSKEVKVGDKSVKVPTFDISWHARGGIFDQPTLLAGADGRLHGVGEAGPEAILPLNKFWDKMDRIADNATGGIVVNVYGSENMSVRELADEVARRIAETEKQRRLAWQ